MSSIHRIIRASAVAVGAISLAAFAIAPAAQAGASSSFIGPFTHNDTITSTVPANGDVNPYGVAVVPTSTGSLVKGDVLVSNFNNSMNLQGTGTTIVQVSPGGKQTVFAQIDASALPGRCPGGVGLTTALGILPGGWVVVGSLPTTDGTSATAKAGCLLVINNMGHVAKTIAGHGINGPWDMATVSAGRVAVLFVSNVLNGTVAAGGATVNKGTVERLILLLRASTPTRRRWWSGRPAWAWACAAGCSWPTASGTGSRRYPRRWCVTAAQAPARWSPSAAGSTRRSAWPSRRTVTSSRSTPGTARLSRRIRRACRSRTGSSTDRAARLAREPCSGWP